MKTRSAVRLMLRSMVLIPLAVGLWIFSADLTAASRTPPGAVHRLSALRDTLPMAFRHESHAELMCETCHDTGISTARGSMRCAACHHEEVVFSECARCHNPGAFEPGSVVVEQTFELTVADSRTADLTFDHRPHLPLGCAQCHGTGGGVRVARECSSCHESHHRPEADCLACHVLPDGDSHRPEVHITTCTASGCHAVEAVVYRGELDNRYLCLICHQDQRQHEPFGVCANCHMVDGK